MAFNSFQDQDDGGVMNEINMTPLVDVMLVLLIVFIITVPVLNHTVQIALPQASTQPEESKPETVTLALDANGQVFWNDQPILSAELATRLEAVSEQKPQPIVQLRADKNLRYEIVAQTMASVQQAGIQTIGFTLEPVAGATETTAGTAGAAP